ncbi:MAG: FecR domain-containing protein [Tannerella sp.]|jgi:ferric-dicitrate binding protein FerR (iron transport regulator)|nr:FecR domain-containing protein [Tannerella sp.]
MNELEPKYRNNRLSSEELAALREKVNVASDSEIELQMYDAWLNEEIDTSFVEDERIKRIKKNVDASVREQKSVFLLLIKWGQIAAAILLPVFILLTAYFYRENNMIISEEMIVSTEKGERAGITLPDGTTVALNWDSKLGYLPKDYNKKERKINFGGEGYFKVYRDKEVPFLINAKGLQVKVLGTTFNLLVRERNNTAELSLEEGSVLLLSTKSNENVILKPNEKAILDQLTGNITVIADENIRNSPAWRRGDMIFRNRELAHILEAIEENYHVKIKVFCENCLEDKFTGTLPLSDLNEALEVIEKSYHLKTEMIGKEIHLKNY